MGWLIGQDEPDIVWAGPDWISENDAASILEIDADQLHKLALSTHRISMSNENGVWEVYAKSIFLLLAQQEN